MLSECDFKNELHNVIERSYYKFHERDSEIKSACYFCRANMDQDHCVLFKIYRQRLQHIELNKLLDEINNRKKEATHLQDCINELDIQRENKEKEIINLKEEIEVLNDKAVKIRANDFLRTTIGGENYLFYMENGYLDITGTNDSIYRITNRGKISKIKIKIKKEGLVDRIKRVTTELLKVLSTDYYQKEKIETLEGQIRTQNYPLEDEIAIVYMNIMKDSDRFDEDKACGQIFARRM